MKNKLIVFGALAIMGLTIAGLHYRIPIVIAAVCVGLAVFAAVTGIQMIVTRKAEIPTSDSSDAHHEHHTGLSAQFMGVLLLLCSAPFGAFGVGVWMYGANPPGTIVDRLARSPVASGIVIMTVGGAMVLYGLTRVLPGKAGFVETRIGPFERWLTAIYLSFVGGLVIVAGLIRALAPGTLTRMRDGAIAWALSLVK